MRVTAEDKSPGRIISKKTKNQIILGQYKLNVVDQSLFNIFSYLNDLTAVCLDFFFLNNYIILEKAGWYETLII